MWAAEHQLQTRCGCGASGPTSAGAAGPAAIVSWGACGCAPRFAPGPGAGGHGLPFDPSHLSWRVQRTLGRSFRFVELANDVNSHMPDYLVRRLVLALNKRGRPVSGSRILLLGLAYKKNTGDARKSPAIRVAEPRLRMGGGRGRRPAVDRADRHRPGGVPRRRHARVDRRDRHRRAAHRP